MAPLYPHFAFQVVRSSRFSSHPSLRRARTALLSDADDSCWYALMLDVAWQTNTSRRGSSNCYWLEEHCHGESPSWIVSLPALLFTSLWTCTALPTVVDVQLYGVSV